MCMCVVCSVCVCLCVWESSVYVCVRACTIVLGREN